MDGSSKCLNMYLYNGKIGLSVDGCYDAAVAGCCAVNVVHNRPSSFQLSLPPTDANLR